MVATRSVLINDMVATPARDHGFERLIFFSDAVFAIAITLLVLDIRLPHDAPSLAQGLADTVPQIFAFLLSFMVIGIYWLNHHRLFSHVTAAPMPLLRVNLLLLLFQNGSHRIESPAEFE